MTVNADMKDWKPILGDRVRNPRMPAWGLGRVLSVAGDSVQVLFHHAGERKLSLKHAVLTRVEGEEARNSFLDLPAGGKRRTRQAVRDFDSMVAAFLRRFPRGFRDPEYIEQERNYKDEASRLCGKLLGERAVAALLARGEEREVADRAVKILNATNLVFPNEKMDLKDGLQDASATGSFARSLWALLYGPGDLSGRFEGFAAVLSEIGASKWTTASYYLFLRFPERFIFVKPMVTLAASDRCGFDIAYRPEVNWPTYRRTLDFAEDLKKRLSHLEPADMIDVQSFIWACGEAEK